MPIRSPDGLVLDRGPALARVPITDRPGAIPRSLVAVFAAVGLLVPSLRAQEAEPAESLVRALASKGMESRVEAARALRERGEEGRLALERFLAPDLVEPAEDRVAAMELDVRVRELVGRLGAPEFELREEATRALLALGPRVLPLLSRLASGDDPEVAERVANVRAAVEATDRDLRPRWRLEAAAALLVIGSRESIPVFRRLLLEEDPRIVQIADAALRFVSPCWPEMAGAAPGLAAEPHQWEDSLARAPEPAAGSIDLSADEVDRLDPSRECRASSESTVRVIERLDSIPDLSLTLRFHSRFSERTVPGRSRPAILRKYDLHESLNASAGATTPTVDSDTGRSFEIPLREPLSCALPGHTVIDPGQALLAALPAGTFSAGDSRVIAGPDVDLLVPVYRFPPDWRFETIARITFLGRDGAGRPRFRLLCHTASFGQTFDRSWTSGEVVLDPEGTSILTYRFAGLADSEAPDRETANLFRLSYRREE